MTGLRCGPGYRLGRTRRHVRLALRKPGIRSRIEVTRMLITHDRAQCRDFPEAL